MPLHLLKLCVGAESIADLQAWIAARMAEQRGRGEPPAHVHTTRMSPKRTADLLAGGSLFWVIRGEIAARQRLDDIQPFVDVNGIGRCRLVLDPVPIAVDPRPHRPFQGWRYLLAREAPPDLPASAEAASLPDALRRTLRDLGLL